MNVVDAPSSPNTLPHTILEQITDAVLVLDHNLKCIYLNIAFERLSGQNRHDLLGKSCWQLAPELCSEQELRKAMALQMPAEFEVFHACQRTWIEVRAFPTPETLTVLCRDITAHKQADEDRSQSEQKYRSLFERNPDAVFAINSQGRFILANPACSLITGYSTEELLTLTFMELCAPDQREAAIAKCQRTFAGEPPENLRTALIGKDGQRIELLVTGGPLVVDGQVVAIHCAAKDITLAQQVDGALRASEAKFRNLFQNSLDATFLANPDGTELLANPAACALFGMSEEELRRAGRAGIIDPTDPHHAAALAQRQRTGKAHTVATFIRKDGSKFHGAVNSAHCSGPTPQVVITIRDITVHKIAQQALQQAKDAADSTLAQLQAVVTSMTDALVIADLQGRILKFNPAALALHGFQSFQDVPQDVPGFRQLFDVADLHGTSLPVEQWPLSLALNGQTFTDRKCRVHRKDTNTRWVGSYSGTPVRDAAGNIMLALITIRDVTQTQAHHEMLHHSEEMHRVSFDLAPVGMAYVTPQGLIAKVNDQLCHITGYPREELLNRPVLDLTHPDDRPADRQVFQRYLDCHQPVYASEKRYLRKDGTIRWVNVTARMVHDADGHPRYSVGIIQDITQHKLADEALAEAKRTAELALASAEAAGQAKDHFLAVLSHELRTPLTPVLITAHMLQVDPTLPKPLADAAKLITRNVDVEIRLIDDLLDLNRLARGKITLHLASVDVHEVLGHAVRTCRPDLRRKNIHLTMLAHATNRTVHGDPARLQQIFWNLLRNAVKFTPTGGNVTIVTSNPHSGGVRVEVADTGIGIDAAVLPRIFNAFEQGGDAVTRQFGGMGLGLAITHNLVELHGGAISAHSDGKDQGARFSVTLPTIAAPAENQAISPTLHLPPIPKGSRALLVEDHPDTAKVMTTVLKTLGLEVQVAHSLADALQSAQATAFDILISDIGLPDGSGLDLIRQLAALKQPPPKAIALSGYGMEEDIRQSLDAGFLAHLTKPIDLHQLEQTLQQLLAP